MTMTYDARNRVVSRTVNGVTTTYAYDGWNLIEDYDGSGNEIASYIHGPQSDEMLAKISSTGTVYYIQDGNQNVTTITDSTGVVQERYTYDVYGTPSIFNASGLSLQVSAFQNRFLFTGREYISQIGVYDYRNRVYSPGLGRFLQTDPMRFDAGDVNIYRYCGNGPVNWVDPSGDDYTLLNDSKGFMNQGHSASLVDNPNGGVDYYSKNGPGAGDTHNHYPSRDSFTQDAAASGRYDREVTIPTSSTQDAAMIDYANKNFNKDYNPFGNECADLSNGIMDAGGIDHSGNDKTGPFTDPNKQFDNLHKKHKKKCGA